jgi:hypothetical protein
VREEDLEGFHGRSQPPELHIPIRLRGIRWSLIPLVRPQMRIQLI